MKPLYEDIELITNYIGNWSDKRVFCGKKVVIFGCNAYTKTIKEIFLALLFRKD